MAESFSNCSNKKITVAKSLAARVPHKRLGVSCRHAIRPQNTKRSRRAGCLVATKRLGCMSSFQAMSTVLSNPLVELAFEQGTVTLSGKAPDC